MILSVLDPTAELDPASPTTGGIPLVAELAGTSGAADLGRSERDEHGHFNISFLVRSAYRKLYY